MVRCRVAAVSLLLDLLLVDLFLNRHDFLPDLFAPDHADGGVGAAFVTAAKKGEKTAAQLYQEDPALMQAYLTDYSVQHAELVTKRWRELGEHLLTTYNDGYVKDENGRPQETGYPESWLREVLGVHPVSLAHWSELLGIALSLLLVMELHKLAWQRLGTDRDVS